MSLANFKRPDVLTLTPAAIARVQELVAKSNDVLGIRVGVKNGGCAGMSYTVEYVKLGGENPLDEIVEQGGVRVYIAPNALMFLIGTQLDFITDDLSSTFKFHNPNQVSACGCGESVELKAASV